LLGTIYTTGLPIISQSSDPDRAFALFLQASKQSHPAATYKVALCYELGRGTKKDAARAAGFYKKASALGHVDAMYTWGRHLIYGTCGTTNPREGITWLKRVVSSFDNGDSNGALWELARIYEGKTAVGETVDEGYSYNLYLRAAQQNHAPSQHRLGVAHERGELNCQVDSSKSLSWFTKSAQNGYSEAMISLSSVFVRNAQPSSDAMAFFWAMQAALQASSKAEWAVGCFLEKGFGCDVDLESAHVWFVKSARQGHKKAQLRCDELGLQWQKAVTPTRLKLFGW
jgi:TPR repeat protein